MHCRKECSEMNRRDFLKVVMAGTTCALLGWEGMANAMQYSLSESFVFPEPVYRTLGRTGIKITIVSFGGGHTTEAEVMRIAFDHGVNYVDTARNYMGGKNEEIVGKALKGRRDKVYVGTKTKPSSNTKQAIFDDVETSLRALGTDYVDVILLHSVASKDRVFIPENREALMKLKEQGKVRFFGVSTHSHQADVLNALVDDPYRFFDVALVGYNFKSCTDVKEAIARAAQANIGIIAMKTQAGGYETEALGPISPHQAALKWVLQNENITAAVPGMTDMAKLREDIAVMGLKYGNVDRFILKSYGAAIRPFYCHLCGKCETTCPKGVQISTINRCLMYAEGYKNIELARASYGEIPASISAAVCLNCARCLTRCVNGINIPEKMERARNLLE